MQVIRNKHSGYRLTDGNIATIMRHESEIRTARTRNRYGLRIDAWQFIFEDGMAIIQRFDRKSCSIDEVGVIRFD